jgi:hypothetical protein
MLPYSREATSRGLPPFLLKAMEGLHWRQLGATFWPFPRVFLVLKHTDFFSGTGRKIATVAPMTGAHRRVARQTSSASAERVGMLATEGIENQVAEPIGRGPIDKLDDLVVGRLAIGIEARLAFPVELFLRRHGDPEFAHWARPFSFRSLTIMPLGSCTDRYPSMVRAGFW